MHATDPKIHILILNYKSWADTIECLESVFRSTYPDYEVVVIDNDSPDGSLNYIKSWAEGKVSVRVNPSHPRRSHSFPPVQKPVPYIVYSRKEAEQGGRSAHASSSPAGADTPPRGTQAPLILIQTGKNLGFAGGNNVALRMLLNRQSRGKVLLLNPDMILQKESLRNAIDCVGADQYEKAIYGFTVKAYSDADKALFWGGGKVNHFSGTIKFIREETGTDELGFISGGALLTDITSFRELGLLPEEYFLYWEETDWCTQAVNRGYSLRACRKAQCYHKGGLGMNGENALADYYYTLGSLKYHRKYYPEKVAFIKGADVLRIMKRIIKGKWQNVLAVVKAMREYKSTRLD